MANTTLVAAVGTFALTGENVAFSVSRNGRYGVAVTNAATTSIDLFALNGFSDIRAGNVLGIVSDQDCYFAFGDSAVTIDTNNDVFVAANEPFVVIAMGRYLGLRSVSAGTANVRIWCR